MYFGQLHCCMLKLVVLYGFSLYAVSGDRQEQDRTRRTHGKHGYVRLYLLRP